MRRMVLRAPGAVTSSPLALEDAEEEAVPAGEIRLEVLACGVCRTDLQIVSGDLAARVLPIVPGHQIVGRVVELGAGVTSSRVGDLVGVGWLASTCGSCAACTSGRENLCAEARFTGWDRHGGYASRATARADFAFPLPAGFEAVDAAPLLCGGVIGYRSLKRAGVRRETAAGQRVGLYGFGASALLALQVARHFGAEVYVATRGAAERERAVAMGAAWAGGYEETPPRPLDCAVTFAPSGDVVVAALRATDRGGTVAINAIHLDRIPSFSYDLLWWERNLVSVANYTRADARELLALAAEIPIRTRFERHPLADANEALARLDRGEVDGSAVLVT